MSQYCFYFGSLALGTSCAFCVRNLNLQNKHKNTKGSQVVSSVSLIVVFFQFSIFFLLFSLHTNHKWKLHTMMAMTHIFFALFNTQAQFTLLKLLFFTSLSHSFHNKRMSEWKRWRATSLSLCNPLKETKNSSHREWRRNRDERRETRSRVYNLRLSFDTRFFSCAVVILLYGYEKKERLNLYRMWCLRAFFSAIYMWEEEER